MRSFFFILKRGSWKQLLQMHLSCDLDIHILCSTAISCRLHFPLSRVKKNGYINPVALTLMVTQSRLFHPPLCFEVCLFVLVPSSNEWHAFPSSFRFSTLARLCLTAADSAWKTRKTTKKDQPTPPSTPTHSTTWIGGGSFSSYGKLAQSVGSCRTFRSRK